MKDLVQKPTQTKTPEVSYTSVTSSGTLRPHTLVTIQDPSQKPLKVSDRRYSYDDNGGGYTGL